MILINYMALLRLVGSHFNHSEYLSNKNKLVGGYTMIRNIKKEDAIFLRDICDICLGYNVSAELVERQIVKLSNDKNHHLIYVYEDDNLNQVVGFIHAEIYESLYSDSGLNILGLAVLPQFQRRGIAKKLLNHLEANFNQQAIKFIRLNSKESRLEAHKFYEKMGYTCDKLQKRFIKILRSSK